MKTETIYEFGDKIYYKSIQTGHCTPCLFLRYDYDGKGVIIFEKAKWTARVNPKLLTANHVASKWDKIVGKWENPDD